MASEEVKLLGAWPSPYVMRARIALNIKSIPYEFIEENLVEKSERLLKSNPVLKQVPVLIHRDRPVCESLVIVQYVDETWATGPRIIPIDPYESAIARFWATYLDTKWFSNIRALLMTEEEEAKKKILEAATQGLVLLEDAFTKCSKGKKFFGGEKIGYLDIALGSLLAWVWVIQISSNVSLIDESNTPHLFKWAQDFSADDAVKDVMPETEKLLEFSKYLKAKLKGK